MENGWVYLHAVAASSVQHSWNHFRCSESKSVFVRRVRRSLGVSIVRSILIVFVFV